MAWTLVVLGEEHDLAIWPKEGHCESSIAWSSEVEQAVAIRGNFSHVPEGPPTLEAKLEEANEVETDTSHQGGLVGQPAVCEQEKCE